MAATTQISVDEYLRTSYAPDCEFVDGEVLDRNVREKGHSKVQKHLLLYIAQHESRWGVFALQEWRLKLGEQHYRVSDLSIVEGPEPDEAVLSTPPLVCAEILSPEDRMSRMLEKIADYLAFGVKYVWVLDPRTKQTFVHTARGVQRLERGVLRLDHPAIEIPLSDIFD
jgi:Uma2 family endonuclease